MTGEPKATIDDPEAKRELKLASIEALFPEESGIGHRMLSLMQAVRYMPGFEAKWNIAMDAVTTESTTARPQFGLAQGSGIELNDDQLVIDIIADSGKSMYVDQWLRATRDLLKAWINDKNIVSLSPVSLSGSIVHGERTNEQDPLIYLRGIARVVRKVIHLKLLFDALIAIQEERLEAIREQEGLPAGAAITPDCCERNIDSLKIDLETVKAYLKAHPSNIENPFGL